MTDTTIAVSDRVKGLLEDEKLEGETYNAVLLRLLDAQDGQMWTREEIKAIAKETFREEARR